MLLYLRNALPLAMLVASTAGTSHAQSTTPSPAPLPTDVADPRTGPLLAPGQQKNTIYTSYKSYLNARYSSDREAQAAVHMFSRKQTGSLLWLLGGGGVLGLLSSQTGTTTTSSGTRTFTISPVGYVVFGGLVAGIGLGKISRFNNQRLYLALKEYDRTHLFPSYVSNKVKDTDYR